MAVSFARNTSRIETEASQDTGPPETPSRVYTALSQTPAVDLDDDSQPPSTREITNASFLDGIFDDGGRSVVVRVTRHEYESMRQRSVLPLTLFSEVTEEMRDPSGHLDRDIDEIFAGVMAGTVPQMAEELHACNPCVIIVVHVFGIMLFTARLVMLWHEKHACISEILKCTVMISAFFVLGVIMPWHAKYLHISDAMRRLLTIREAYQVQSAQHRGIRHFAKYYPCIQWISIFMATVTPVSSLAQIVTELDENMSYETQPLSIFIGANGTLWFVLMAGFGMGAVELVCIDASEICVEGLASELDIQTEVSDTKDWASFHRKCVKFHQVLDSVWDLPGVGGLWLCRVVLLFSASIGIGALSIHRRASWMRLWLRVFAATLAVAGSYLLLRLALITLQCVDLRPNSRSITELALRLGGRIRGDRERMEYQAFMTYLQMGCLGIQIRGIAITLPLVAMVFGNMVGTFQLALFYTEHILYPQDQDK